MIVIVMIHMVVMTLVASGHRHAVIATVIRHLVLVVTRAKCLAVALRHLRSNGKKYHVLPPNLVNPRDHRPVVSIATMNQCAQIST